MSRDRLADVLLIVVTIIGLFNFLAQFFVHGYKPDPIVTISFWGIAGSILGVKGVVSWLSSVGRGPDKGSKDDN